MRKLVEIPLTSINGTFTSELDFGGVDLPQGVTLTLIYDATNESSLIISNLNLSPKVLEKSEVKNSSTANNLQRNITTLPSASFAFVDGVNILSNNARNANIVNSASENQIPIMYTNSTNESSEIFVNATTGNDSNIGTSALPKLTISGALNTSGNLYITLQSSTQVYSLSTISANGRNIVIRSSGNITIKGQ